MLLRELLIKFASIALLSMVLVTLSGDRHPTWRKIGYALLVISIAVCISGFDLAYSATSHGARQETVETYTVGQLMQGIRNSHRQTLPKEHGDLADAYVLYYKFTCQDCQKTYRDLQDWLGKNDIGTDLYYVPSDSEYGQELRKDFPVKAVPSLVYIYPNGSTYYVRQIYTEDSEGARFLPAALEDIVSLRNEVVSP